MDRSFVLVKIYGMDREERSLVFGQYPRVKARPVSFFARPRRLNSQHSRLSQGRASGAVGCNTPGPSRLGYTVQKTDDFNRCILKSEG
ncbi:BQ5605_C028g10497 [Microbotryum silenes-dioicae]|uniref:BQ5605_C028g10497 protein n=1 Tax=Microbotryum silenes-dioicae TaxID=796604 RepID=A0A2X0PJM0_9BASI|nr:BQ5605_C028g10497 [Microbotryum silenes-dioicae]